MAFKKLTPDGVVEFRSKYPSLEYQVKPGRGGDNPERAILVNFMNGVYRTEDALIISKLRDAITRMPIASEGHGLKTWVTEQEAILDPTPFLQEQADNLHDNKLLVGHRKE